MDGARPDSVGIEGIPGPALVTVLPEIGHGGRPSANAHRMKDDGQSPKEVACRSGDIGLQRNPSGDCPWAVQALLIMLSVTAGSTDTIGFLDLNGLFTAHITGNLVILAAHLVDRGDVQIAKMLAVPVFIVMVDVAILLAGGLKAIGHAPLRPLLLLQFVLLATFLILCVAAGTRIDANATNVILAGMFGVSAMAVQNALVQVSLKGAPSTAVMTTNITRFATDVGEVLVGTDQASIAQARKRAARTLPVIVSFAVGCGLGAACEAVLGLLSLALPACLALLAFVLGFAIPPDEARSHEP
jgi:uncharacterized membrane protein YoaK (UPF0700 family)